MFRFHPPLPEGLYRDLREELWLRHRRKKAHNKAIARFAAENAGSPMDHDPELEAASIEHLLAANARKD
jgi:hypothetical protein